LKKKRKTKRKNPLIFQEKEKKRRREEEKSRKRREERKKERKMSHSSSEEFDLNTLERGETFEGPLIQKPTLKAWGEKQKESLKYRCTTKAGWLETLYSLMPVFYWIPRYNARDNIMGDLIAGYIFFISFEFSFFFFLIFYFFFFFFKI